MIASSASAKIATLVRFGKAVGPLLQQKTIFLENNDELLAYQKRLAMLYKGQPPRTTCMTCDAPIGSISFIKMGVPFSQCKRCGHLNGMHIDTDEYCEALYTVDGGKAYARSYFDPADVAQYDVRVRDIYLPKAEFLLDALRACGENPERLSFVDLGAGSGYLLAALDQVGIAQCQGYDVSTTQIAFAKAMRPGVRLEYHDLAAVYSIAETVVAADVVCMIGVLEHLRHPRRMLTALKANPHVRYLYLSVPLFSLSVFLELPFPRIMQRHLSGGHTHLYTEKSLQYLCDEFDFDRCAEWWFGLDVADLYRAFHLTYGDVANSLLPLIDQLQLGIDEKKQSSEVHMLWRLKS